MAFVIYGFFFFILLRHTRNLKVHTFLIIGWVIVVLFLGVARIYFGTQMPSQILGGYVFGGVWLGFSVLLLELFRVLTSLNSPKKISRMNE
jgi:membrane-associated phospholipid phosphatase